MAALNQYALMETSRNSRGRVRHALLLEVAAYGSSSEVAESVVLNLSTTGLLIQTSASLAMGEEIQIHLPHVGSKPATVVWSIDSLFGCKFRDELPTAALSAALLLSPFDVQNFNEELAASHRRGADPTGDLWPVKARFWTIVGLAVVCWTFLVGAITWLFV